MEEKKNIMDESAMQRAITRITYEVLERNRGADHLCVIGILSRGAILAQRISKKILELENVSVNCGSLDITSYRDDKKIKEHNEQTNIDFSVEGQKVILVADVLYTGRSCRAAIDAILAIGRPQWIQLAVLVDRGHRELPIRPDYIGKNLPTAKTELVKVCVKELDGIDHVSIYTK